MEVIDKRVHLPNAQHSQTVNTKNHKGVMRVILLQGTMQGELEAIT